MQLGALSKTEADRSSGEQPCGQGDVLLYSPWLIAFCMVLTSVTTGRLQSPQQ